MHFCSDIVYWVLEWIFEIDFLHLKVWKILRQVRKIYSLFILYIFECELSESDSDFYNFMIPEISEYGVPIKCFLGIENKLKHNFVTLEKFWIFEKPQILSWPDPPYKTPKGQKGLKTPPPCNLLIKKV